MAGWREGMSATAAWPTTGAVHMCRNMLQPPSWRRCVQERVSPQTRPPRSPHCKAVTPICLYTGARPR